jgi:hypothetical protein
MPETGAIKFDGYLSQHCIRYTHVQINNSINTVTCTIITELIAASEQKKNKCARFSSTPDTALAKRFLSQFVGKKQTQKNVGRTSNR